MIKEFWNSIKPTSLINIYVLLWCLYYLQGTLYESGSIVSQVVLVIIILLSMVPFVNVIRDNTINYFFKPLRNFMFLLLVYGVIYWLSGKTYYVARSGTEIQGFGAIKQIIISFTPIFVGYYYAKRKEITAEKIKIWSILFLIVVVFFYYHEQRLSIAYAIINNSSATEFVNNSSYFFLALIPSFLLWKEKPLIQYSLLGVSLLFILLCMKRGAILCAVPCVYLFFKHSYRDIGSKYRAWVFVLVCALLFLGYYVIDYLFLNSDLFLDRIIETKAGNSSSRDTIYSSLLSYAFSRENPFYWFFGEGSNATLLHSENYAHNDWIELFVDNGILGIILYLGFWKGFYKCVKFSSGDTTVHMALKMIFTVFLIRTFFSMTYADFPVFVTLFLGYFLSHINSNSYCVKD